MPQLAGPGAGASGLEAHPSHLAHFLSGTANLTGPAPGLRTSHTIRAPSAPVVTSWLSFIWCMPAGEVVLLQVMVVRQRLIAGAAASDCSTQQWAQESG